jgi:hypothetical protein
MLLFAGISRVNSINHEDAKGTKNDLDLRELRVLRG